MMRKLRPLAPVVLLAASGWGLAQCAPIPEPASASQLSEAQARRLLEQAYAEQRRALLAKDAEMVLRLRTPDFEAILPDGRIVAAEQQAAASRDLLANVAEWLHLTNDLGEIRVNGNELAVEVTQHTARRQMRDGVMRRIENWVVQTETWVRTPEGLRLRRVENIRDQCVLFDGRIREGIRPEACRRYGVTAG
jgi:ketosteroid isomerase-like protein